MESLRCSFLRRHFAGQPSVASARNVSCFLRLPLGPQSRNAPRPDGFGQGALHPLHRDSGPSGCKGDHPHTKWLVFFSLFLTYSFLFFFFFFFDILFFFHAFEWKSQVLQVRHTFFILCSPGNSRLHYRGSNYG